MNLFQAARGQYVDRLERAHYLANAHPFAAEFLNFYQGIAQFQKTLYHRMAADAPKLAPQLLAALAPANSKTSPPIRESFHAALVLPHFRAFLEVIARTAPAPLADSARQLGSQPPSFWLTLLSDHWRTAGLPAGFCSGEPAEAHSVSHFRTAESSDSHSPASPISPSAETPHLPPAISSVSPASDSSASPAANPFAQFVPRAFLQPYAEFLAEQIPMPTLLVTATLCPLCGGAPLLGVLRREGDGGKRFLLCSFCSQEWEFRRILCPYCGEQSETQLPVYVAEQFPHIRVEACDTCRSYLRTIDLTTDGHAIPLVDDLAALPLSLWAHERHYSRPQPNLLGT
jgi:formate dehydrogenase maturation protein FdhE